MSAVYIEFTEYYYPDGKDFPSKRVSYFVIIYLSITWQVFFSCKVSDFYKCEKKSPLFFTLVVIVCSIQL